MRRQEFFGLVASAMSWPLSGHTQQTILPVVGFLNSASADAEGRKAGRSAGHATDNNSNWSSTSRPRRRLG